MHRIAEAARRLGGMIDPEDLRMLLPHKFAAEVVKLASGVKAEPRPTPLEARDPAFVGALLELVREVGRVWFRWRVEGIEHLPASGPALLVGNHNGGLFTFDTLLTYLAVWDRFGPGRALYGLGHDAIQWDPMLRRYGDRLGILRAAHDEAGRALAAGHLALVYPGSDFDSFRPFGERGRIVLAERTGFVRLGLRSRVPVVPVVGVGGQEQFVVVTRGEGLAKRLGMHRRLRAKVFPLGFSVPWGFTSALLPYLPLPAQITVRFLPPLRWDRHLPGAENDPAVVAACREEIRGVMQGALDELQRGRVPWLGRPGERTVPPPGPVVPAHGAG